MPFLRARIGSATQKPRHTSRGQGLVEFALTVPVLLIILLIAIDAGRLFFGYIALQNATRIAANYASTHPDDWPLAGAPATNPSTYNEQIDNDTPNLECDAAGARPIFTPDAKPRGAGDGNVASVTLDCVFHPLTPIISNIIGDAVTLRVTEAFPIRAGILAGVPIAPGLPTPTPSPTPTPTPSPTPTASPGASPTPTPIPTPRPGECTVPTIIGTTTSSAVAAWTGAGFKGTKFNVTIGPPDYKVVREYVVQGSTPTFGVWDGTFQNCNSFALNVTP